LEASFDFGVCERARIVDYVAEVVVFVDCEIGGLDILLSVHFNQVAFACFWQERIPKFQILRKVLRMLGFGALHRESILNLSKLFKTLLQ
jgi:hypothetical protein